MLNSHREEFSSHAPPKLLEQMRRIAEMAGRDFESVLENAMRAYTQNNKDELLRHEALKRLETSFERHDQLGKLRGKT